jgi:hypothetical protein
MPGATSCCTRGNGTDRQTMVSVRSKSVPTAPNLIADADGRAVPWPSVNREAIVKRNRADATRPACTNEIDVSAESQNADIETERAPSSASVAVLRSCPRNRRPEDRRCVTATCGRRRLIRAADSRAIALPLIVAVIGLKDVPRDRKPRQ